MLLEVCKKSVPINPVRSVCSKSLYFVDVCLRILLQVKAAEKLFACTQVTPPAFVIYSSTRVVVIVVKCMCSPHCRTKATEYVGIVEARSSKCRKCYQINSQLYCTFLRLLVSLNATRGCKMEVFCVVSQERVVKHAAVAYFESCTALTELAYDGWC